MNSVVKTTTKKPAKTAVKAVHSSSGSALRGTVLTGQALIDDMRAFRREVAANPTLAQALLVKIGAMTKGGKLKTLIRA